MGCLQGGFLRQARAGGKRKERLLALGFSLRYNKKQPYFEGESRTVDMHIKSLRHKLGGAAGLIHTVRGVGYKIGGDDA